MQEICELCDACERIFRDERTVLELHGGFEQHLVCGGSYLPALYIVRGTSSAGGSLMLARTVMQACQGLTISEKGGAIIEMGGLESWSCAQGFWHLHSPASVHAQRLYVNGGDNFLCMCVQPPSRFLVTCTASLAI